MAKPKTGGTETRIFGDWITEYIQWLDNTETPPSFHAFVGLWVLASALQRKTWLANGDARIYPNLFACLVAPPATARKTTAIRYGTRLLKTLGNRVHIVPSKITPEAFIDMMAEVEQTFTYDAKTYKHNSVCVASDELASFLGRDDDKFLDCLTDWFDCKEPWDYRTIARGNQSVSGLCVSIMGGATPGYISELVPSTAIDTGFTSRFIFIYEAARTKVVPTPTVDKATELKLCEDLAHINAHFTGPLHLSPSAQRWYVEWYASDAYKTLDDERFVYYIDRKPVHMLKVAFLLHVSRSDSYELTVEDLEASVALLNSIEANMPDAFGQMGKNPYTILINRISDHITRSANPVTEPELLARFWRDLPDGDRQLLDIIQGLRKTGAIEALKSSTLVDLQGQPLRAYRRKVLA